MPRRYAGYATCWRRLRSWEEAGVFVKVWRAFLSALNADERIVWEEAFADGTFASAKKGAPKLVRLAKGRAQRS